MARKKVMKWRSGCRVAWKPSGAWVGCGAFSKEVYLSCLLLKSVHTALVRSLRNRPHVDCETISLGAQSFEHANVLSEKINFSALGGPEVAIFGPNDLHPMY